VGPRDHHPPDRARHEGGHGRLRADHRARPRPEDHRGCAREGTHGPAGDRGLPRETGLRPTVALLEVDDIHTYYGNIQALKGVSLTVDEGEIVTMLGSNGAGKSTTLRSISGLTPPRRGAIRFGGEDISQVPPQNIVRHGVSL